MKSKIPDKQKAAFEKWISDANVAGLSAFERCAKDHLNSGKYRFFKLFTVPIYKWFYRRLQQLKIKVLKRNAYGLKNFKRFRNRILFLFSSQRCRA